MRILINEIKKILNWKIISTIALINIVLYFLLIDFDIKHFPNGRPALDSYNIGAEMTEKYGSTMNEEELADFKEVYFKEIEKADQLLLGREDAKLAGIHSYEDLRNSDSQFRSKIFFEERINVFWELQERSRLIEFHEGREENLKLEKNRATPAQRQLIEKLQTSRQHAIYPTVSVENYKSIIRSIAIIVLISVALLISPLILRDRNSRLIDLQYTSKKGRGLFKTKVLASLFSSFFLMTALMIVYFVLYSQNHPEPFFNIPMNSFIGEYHWYNINFFQYIVLTITATYLLGFVLTFLSLTVSNIVPNTVSLIGVQIPILFGLIALGLSYLLGKITSYYVTQWSVPTGYLILLITGISFISMQWRREKKIDIL